jgi:hypothetical protein
MPYEYQEVDVDCLIWNCDCNLNLGCCCDVETQDLSPNNYSCTYFIEDPDAEPPNTFIIFNRDGERFTHLHIKKDGTEIVKSDGRWLKTGYVSWTIQDDRDTFPELKFCYYQGTLLYHPKDQMLLPYMDSVPTHTI